MTARQQLIEMYLDWKNNYVSLGTYAMDNGLSINEAMILINLGRSVFEHKHPEA